MRSFLLLLGAGYAAALSVKRAPGPEGTSSYFGCWTEAAERQLGGDSYADEQMTPAACISFCNSKNYIFAGVEYARECFCGHAIRSQSTLTSDTECNMPCTGDLTKTCGGPNRLNIYKNDALPSVATNPGPVGSGWTYTSCYDDSVYARTLSVRVDTPTTPNTVSSCTSACRMAGYKFAGVEYSNECWCDNTILAGRNGGQSGCEMTCSGNPNEYCGGAQRLNLYSLDPQLLSTSTTTTTSSSPSTSSTTTTLATTTSSTTTTSQVPSTTTTTTTISTTSSTTSSSTTTTTTTTTTSSTPVPTALRDGAFESTSSSPWTILATPPSGSVNLRDTSGPHGGSQALALALPVRQAAQVQQVFTGVRGRAYTGSMWIRQSNNGLGCYTYVDMIDATTQAYIINLSGGYQVHSGWGKYNMGTWTADRATPVKFIIGSICYQQSTTLYIDDVVFE